MVTIRRFKFKDFKHLVYLHESQGASVEFLTYRTLPKLGYMAFLGQEPIAAGFLRRLEPNFAHMDTLVSNGRFGSKVRHEGVSKVVDELLRDAKTLKLAGIVGTTSDAGILKRVQELGFKVIPQTLLALKLT